MDRSHTKGPWFVCGDAGFRSQNESWREGLTIGSASEGTRVCDVTTLRIREHAEADASLIAAAPDMYKALLQARDWLEGWASAEPQLAIINAALAKAEGLGQRADATPSNPSSMEER